MHLGGITLHQGAQAFWELVPYAYAEPELEEAFQKEVATWLRLPKDMSLSDPRWMKKIKERVMNVARRGELGKMYTKLMWRDRNLSSMALFAGPTEDFPTVAMHDPWGNGSGWMGTGDMHLDVKKRLAAFETFYGERLQRSRTFMLPHHGSKKNIRTSFLMGEERHRTWVAAHGLKNSYGHPDKHLMHVANSFGTAFGVTERRSSEFVQSYRIQFG